MGSRAPLPIVTVDPQRMARLLPEELYNTALAAPDTPASSRCPLWTRSMETFYHTVYPAFWILLEKDDRCDMALFVRYRHNHGRSLKRGEEDVAAVIQQSLEAIRARRESRWSGLFALHVARRRFLDFQRKEHPTWSASDIQRSMLPSTCASSPQALPLSPPPSLDPPLITPETPGHNWGRFTIPLAVASLAAAPGCEASPVSPTVPPHLTATSERGQAADAETVPCAEEVETSSGDNSFSTVESASPLPTVSFVARVVDGLRRRNAWS
ncbi:uncharacterized protein JCM10292_001716 [Rhodotorula paludigena]|uniref:uncharacterized protein n=1 Tax=Rhodotorula paludigena TaxID=86838 RepID=UPI00317DC29D